jgi:hypothetical protein
MKKIILVFLWYATSALSQPFPIELNEIVNAKGTLILLEGCQRTPKMENFWTKVVDQANSQGWQTIRWSTAQRLGLPSNCALSWEERAKDAEMLRLWVSKTYTGKIWAIGGSQGAVAVTSLANTTGWDKLIALSPQCGKIQKPVYSEKIVIFTGDNDTTSATDVCKTWDSTNYIDPTAYHGWQYYNSKGPHATPDGKVHVVSYSTSLSNTFWNWFKTQ